MSNIFRKLRHFRERNDFTQAAASHESDEALVSEEREAQDKKAMEQNFEILQGIAQVLADSGFDTASKWNHYILNIAVRLAYFTMKYDEASAMKSLKNGTIEVPDVVLTAFMKTYSTPEKWELLLIYGDNETRNMARTLRDVKEEYSKRLNAA